MSVTELLVERPPTEAALVTACAALLAIPAAAITVVSDIAAWPASPGTRLVCELAPVRGDFATKLGLYPRDAGLAAVTAPGFVERLAERLAERLGCACLASDDSPNPYSWWLIRGEGRRERVFLDGARLDQDEYVLAGWPAS